MLQAWWEARFVEPWKSRFTAAESKDHRTDTLNGAFSNRSNTRTRQLIWDNEVRAGAAHALSGRDSRDGEQTLDSASSFGADPLREREVERGRLGYLGRLGDHYLQANYRYEDYSDFGSEGTYYLGYGYDLTERVAPHAEPRARRSARRPSSTWTRPSATRTCKPERSQHQRDRHAMGVRAAPPARGRTSTPSTRTRSCSTSFFIPQNVQTASNQGIETSYSGVLAGFDLRASLTFQDPVEQDRTNEPPQQALRRAKTLAALSASPQLRRLAPRRANGATAASGATEHQRTSTVTVFEPAYSVLNLMARYQLSKNLCFGARLENALDEDYRLVNGYNTAGRGVFLSAGWQP